jgi:hypothetical protein
MCRRWTNGAPIKIAFTTPVRFMPGTAYILGLLGGAGNVAAVAFTVRFAE